MEIMEYIILGRDIFAAASRLSVKKQQTLNTTA